ncbi:IS606 transposase (plasmid) [Helicobacter cetorum MIT 99-5656]|uniref:IS606 transposase n=1 Tax=Helicobacter cetorum (strain ATCC BAA-540 / CCUG 52418 / MIT 99-5656) TaxID=1163745 RepID=I0ERL3_HELCM|nr:IS606 transposase [Helicobacter cetorum MIT 99-5656]AFI05415.1 IS606 transposase [Helicobacter cetorum MIT 99-5656]AFI05467.1 IS606 transposase [Helicobacter cetorum MIT 99-5656]AFI05502.1 IS606 transposase [Helicobacter cetorum MIT 99-5656]AFI05582.1 IS606 transposase [Helicobacter cetorum MIT 99-5656]
MYPTKEQQTKLQHSFFVYNQAYNICLNLQQEQYEKNKDLPTKQRKWQKSSELDSAIKHHLKARNLSFSSVVAQQSRMNAERALRDAFKVKNRGFPKFKNSKFAKQSFTWNNQGFSIKDFNERFKMFNLMKMPLKMRMHRDLPLNAKIKQIVVSCSHQKYFVSFSIEYEKELNTIKEPRNCVGVDLNIYDIALSVDLKEYEKLTDLEQYQKDMKELGLKVDENINLKRLIPTYSKLHSFKKYSKEFKRLQRKQSRRVLKSKQNKIKLGGNFYKTQKKLNKAFDKSSYQKLDRYHKITSELSKQFELIVVEDLQIKNMTKRAKLKNVKQKSGLNKSILNTSFYQIISFLDYKQQHNGKLLVKAPPQYTSKTCHSCGQINHELKLNHREYLCQNCGYIEHRDINAASNILSKGLSLLGLGNSLADFKEQSLSY